MKTVRFLCYVIVQIRTISLNFKPLYMDFTYIKSLDLQGKKFVIADPFNHYPFVGKTEQKLHQKERNMPL